MSVRGSGSGPYWFVGGLALCVVFHAWQSSDALVAACGLLGLATPFWLNRR
jgi:hypothetical protein